MELFFLAWTLLELRFLYHHLEHTVDLELILFWNSRRCQMWIKVNPIHCSGITLFVPTVKRNWGKEQSTISTVLSVVFLWHQPVTNSSWTVKFTKLYKNYNQSSDYYIILNPTLVVGLFLFLRWKSNSLLTRSKTQIMNTDKTYDCETCGKYHTRQKTKQFWYHVFSKIVQASVGTIPHGIKVIVMMTDNGRKHLVFKSRSQILKISFWLHGQTFNFFAHNNTDFGISACLQCPKACQWCFPFQNVFFSQNKNNNVCLAGKRFF